VLLEWSSQHLRAIVEDDGCGFEVAGHQERKLGLYGMEERATLIGGALKIESQPDLGTMIVVTVPTSAPSPLVRGLAAEVTP
jgi:two-component system sensor histidine kinase DegS